MCVSVFGSRWEQLSFQLTPVSFDFTSFSEVIIMPTVAAELCFNNKR